MALLDFFRTRRTASPEHLGRFLQSQAAYVAQKTVLDYCRVKSGRSERALFSNSDFQAALAHCRWQVFFSAMTDVTAMIEAHLRPHSIGEELVLVKQLFGLHEAALRSETPPDEEAPSAADARAALPLYLTKLQLEPPQPAHRLPLLAEPVLFATLPVHADQRRGEAIAITGALRFQMVTTQQELERRFDTERLARNLLTSRQSFAFEPNGR